MRSFDNWNLKYEIKLQETARVYNNKNTSEILENPDGIQDTVAELGDRLESLITFLSFYRFGPSSDEHRGASFRSG